MKNDRFLKISILAAKTHSNDVLVHLSCSASIIVLKTVSELFESDLAAKIEFLKIENFSKGTPFDRDFGHFESLRKPIS